jgi:3',5'-cyclic AMP phosphodiesterase CpdA
MFSDGRPIVHVSDLHYDGSVERRALVEAEFARILLHEPGLIILSGDLSATGSDAEFVEVAELLAVFGDVPVIVTPGNRDLPELDLREMWEIDDEDEGTHKWEDVKAGLASTAEARVASDLLAGDESSPVGFVRAFGACGFWWSDDDCAVVSLNSNRKVYRAPLEAAATVLRRAAPEALRIAVCHHPFTPVPARPWESDIDTPRNAGDVLRALLEARVDITCTGHLHRSHTGVLGIDGRAMQLSMAPTLIYSTRKKDRGYHLLRRTGEHLEVEAVHTREPYRVGGLRGTQVASAGSTGSSTTRGASDR